MSRPSVLSMDMRKFNGLGIWEQETVGYMFDKAHSKGRMSVERLKERNFDRALVCLWEAELAVANAIGRLKGEPSLKKLQSLFRKLWVIARLHHLLRIFMQNGEHDSFTSKKNCFGEVRPPVDDWHHHIKQRCLTRAEWSTEELGRALQVPDEFIPGLVAYVKDRKDDSRGLTCPFTCAKGKRSDVYSTDDLAKNFDLIKAKEEVDEGKQRQLQREKDKNSQRKGKRTQHDGSDVSVCMYRCSTCVFATVRPSHSIMHRIPFHSLFGMLSMEWNV